MQQILTQQDARRASVLPFCYLCGAAITADQRRGQMVNRDHIPPRNLFPKASRDWPLILPTHAGCNNRQSTDDEIIGGVLQSGEQNAGSAAEAIRRSPERYSVEGSPHLHGVFDAAKIEQMVWRWVRGFHAALYGKFLPDGTKRHILPPFPMLAEINGHRQGIDVSEVKREMILLLKGNRSVGNIDRIESNNKQCLFHCVWQQTGNGCWEAVFGLKVCDWEWCGHGPTPMKSGCVGCYEPPLKPSDAATASTKMMPFINGEPDDPFGR